MSSNGKRSQVRYHGLRNQGATCYLNSVLQVLFMTKDYRDAVKSKDRNFIDHHLKTLFDDLQKETSNTKEITRKLGIDRVYEQRDAAEYYEKILNLTSPEASQIFHGQLTHRTICASCGDEADSDAAFWHLPLALVDPHSYSVENGIKEYFKDADFNGENQMYCDRCDDKSDATIKCLVKHHPEVLMLLLKRFEFNFTYMTYVKNNCIVEIPYTLKIPQNQMYKLYAVVDHYGDLRSGHYTATIKSQDDGRWYTFNDATVSLNDYQSFQVDQSETSSSAYLLFYKKVKEHGDDTCYPNISEMSSPEDFTSATSDINGHVEEKSEEEEQASNDIAESVSINGNVETETETEIETEGLPPDTHSNVKSQDTMTSDSQEDNEEKNQSSYNPQDAHTEITMTDADMRGKEETDDEVKEREKPSKENPLEERVEDQKNVNERQKTPDTHFDTKAAVSDELVIRGHPNKQDEMNEEQRSMKDVDTEKVEMTRDDEESGVRTNYPDRDAEHQDKAALKYIGLKSNQNLGDSHEVEQHLDLQTVNRQGDQKRMKEADEKGENTGDEMKGPKNKKLYTKYDLYLGTVGDDKQKMPKDDEKCKAGKSNSSERQGQQRRDKGDDKKVKEQNRGDNIDTQSKGQSESEHDNDQDGDQSNTNRSGETAENKPERNLSSTQAGHEDVSVVRQTKRQQNENGLAENQGVGVKRRRKEESPVQTDDTFNPNISEMSSPEDFTSATSDHNDQGEEESKEAEQASEDITAPVSINGNVETETERKTECLTPDTDFDMESGDTMTSNSQEDNEEKNQSSYNPQDAHTEITTTDADMRGKEEVDDETEYKESLGIEDSVHTGGQKPQADTHSNEESHDNKTSSQENNEERTESSYNPQDASAEITMTDADMRRKVETDDKEKEKEKPSEENPLEERVEDQKNDSEREKTLDTKPAVSDEHVIQDDPNKQDVMKEKQKTAEEENTEMVEKIGNDEESERKEKFGTDCLNRDAEYQDKAASSDTGLNTKDTLSGSQEVKQNHDFQTIIVNEQGDQETMKEEDRIREIEDEKDTQSKDQSESQHEYFQDGDQSNNRSGETAENKPEGKLSSTQAGHEDVSVVRQTKEQHNEKDRDAQSEADSPHRQEGSAGSRGGAENQEFGSGEIKRKEESPVQAEGTCHPNITERSSADNPPSATSDHNDQVEEESEEAEQASKDITASVPINRNVETETERETEGLPPDTQSDVEHYDNMTSNSQKDNEVKNQLSCIPQDAHTEITMTDADVRGKEETGDKEKEKEKPSKENPLEERVEDQKNDSEREKTLDTKPAVSDEHVIQDYSNEQDEMNEEQKTAEDENTEMVEKIGDDEESERKEKFGTDCLNRDADNQDKAASSDTGLNTKDTLSGSQEVKQNHDFQTGIVNEQGDQETMKEEDKIKEIEDEKDTQSKGQPESEHEYVQDGDQSNNRSGETAENKPEGKLSFTQAGHEDVSVVRQTKEQHNEKDRDAQSEADSPHRQEGSAGSRGGAENQEFGSGEIRGRDESPVQAEGTCNLNISERSSAENFPSATSDHNDQGEKESEEAEQASKDITAPVSINGNVGKERETECLPPDTQSDVESQDTMTSNSQEDNEEKNQPSYNPQDAHTEITTTDADVRGKEETGDKEKEKEKPSKENPLEERVEDQKNDSEREKTLDTKPAVSDEHVIEVHPNKQDEMKEKQKRVIEVKTENVEMIRDDEGSEKKEISGTDYPDKDAENQDKAASSDTGLNTKDTLSGSQEVRLNHDFQTVIVNEQGDQETMKEEDKIKEIEDEKDTQSKGQPESEHEYVQDGDQSNNRSGETAENKPEGKLSSTQAGHEDVSVVRQTKEQHNEKDKDAQSEADSPHRQEGSAGSRGGAENQKVGSGEIKRKEESPVQAEGTCNPNITERSSAENFPSATSDNNDQGEKESEEAEQASKDITAPVSINGNVETEIETEGLPPDTQSDVESRDTMTTNSQENIEERTESSYNPQDASAEITMTDADMRGKEETDDKEKEKEKPSKENPLEERVEDQKNDSEREKTLDTKPAVSDEHVIQDDPNKQDEMNEEQKTAEEENTETVEKIRNDEESEGKEKFGTDCLNRDADNQDKAASSDTGLNTKEKKTKKGIFQRISFKRQSGRKKDQEASLTELTESVSRLSLNDPGSPEQQKSLSQESARKSELDTQPEDSQRKVKKKKDKSNKTPGCFPLLQTRQKKSEQTPEQD